jgi:hypothetical protein
MKPLFLAFSALLATTSGISGTANRCGIDVTVPDRWRVGLGTCTGDLSYSPPGANGEITVRISVGERRYLDRNQEYMSTADVYQIHSFRDIRTVVPETLGEDVTLFDSVSFLSSRGAAVLVMRFKGFKSWYGTELIAEHAFIDVPEKRSALEIACVYTEANRTKGHEIFEAALKSAVSKEPPNRVAGGD